MDNEYVMNILLFSWRGPKHPHAGGAEISTHEHAKGWVNAGHKVTLFTSMYKNAKQQEYIDGVHIIRKGSQFFGVHLEAFKWFMFERKEQFDIVIDEFHGIPFFTPLFIRIKKIGFIHEITKEVWKLNSWNKPLNLLPAVLGTVFEPLIFRLFYINTPFMTVSQSTRQDLVNWRIPKRNITVIHNGINIPKTGKLPSKEKNKTAIFLGAISKDKGIEDVIKIFKEIDNKEQSWQFWVVGKSDLRYLKVVKNLTKKLGIFNKINFFGYVSENKKFELLSKAHVLINPSIREGWGLVVLEGASVGTPTVGYNVPGLKDSILDNKTGILCDPKPEICAEAILVLMNDQKKYNFLNINCINWSKKFRWEDACKQSLKLIQAVMKSY